MEIHHTKHHKSYIEKLNAALKEENISGMTIEEILEDFPSLSKNDILAVLAYAADAQNKRISVFPTT